MTKWDYLEKAVMIATIATVVVVIEWQVRPYLHEETGTGLIQGVLETEGKVWVSIVTDNEVRTWPIWSTKDKDLIKFAESHIGQRVKYRVCGSELFQLVEENKEFPPLEAWQQGVEVKCG